MNTFKRLVVSAALLSVSLPVTTYAKTALPAQPPVKRSVTMICHAKGTTYYKQTLKFTVFKSLADCVKSGGRLPKR